SLAPCDNVFHGTHTMGTMVGDDGDPGANQIGVAPHAKWIAAKGCESSSCSFSALLASGQWVIAPTDLNGQNPRPDLAPAGQPDGVPLRRAARGLLRGHPGLRRGVDRMPGTRLFDVIAEGTLELPALDVAGEVGSFAADRHTFRVTVTDG